MTTDRTYLNGPILWNKLLSVAHTIDPCAVIAGGAVRDLLLGIPPKDIDVFVNTTKDKLFAWNDSHEIMKGFELGALSPEMADMNYALDTDWSPATMGVLDGNWYPNYDQAMAEDGPRLIHYKVQFISHPFESDFGMSVHEYADAIMNRMDIGLCQAVWKGGEDHADIMTTPEFAYDMANFKLSIIRQQSKAGLEASIRRVERIMSRLNAETISGFSWRDA